MNKSELGKRFEALFSGLDWRRVRALSARCPAAAVWLKDTLEAVTAGHPNDRLDDLLPWSFKPPSS